MEKCIRDPESPCEECSICGRYRKRNNSLVYCTNCINFEFDYIDDDTRIPTCIHNNECDLSDCEDSKPFEERPFYESIWEED